MKKQFVSLVFSALILTTLLVLGSIFQGMCWKSEITPNSGESAEEAGSRLGVRTDIVFILGEDELEGNPYYEQATNYFRFRENIRLENLVVHCRSLSEVREYLVWNKADSSLAWGKVHLVVHGNQWNGLSLPVVPGGPRTSATSIPAAKRQGYFEPLSETVLDEKSELIFHACGTGHDLALMEQISAAFGGRATVRSARFFVSYESVSGVPQSTRQYMSDYWFTTYPTGHRPIDAILANQLEEENPTAGIEWMGALSRTHPRWMGDVYHYRFSVPVHWTVTFSAASDMSQLETKVQQNAWLATQTDLLDKLAEIGIPASRFSWKFEKTTYTFPDGQVEPAIQIEGKSSILCVLKAITDGDQQLPLAIDLEDERYYAAVQPR
ncbi:MAG: hypothetical protein KDC34_20230 [Saprospiraceae bacterium]|nr:hypothetical protein [Saprospiraceae bacterium]